MRIETDSQHYTDIAEAIRDMNGTENTYYPEEMASAILAIPQEIYDVYAPIIYSLEEREIGVWTDGKPLYQRTFSGSLTPSASSDIIFNLSDYDIGEIIRADGYIKRASMYGFCLQIGSYLNGNHTSAWYKSGDGSFMIYHVPASEYDTYVVTVQYTKTTDTAGSGSWTPQGVPAVHYDGTERIIGTWFGETLYQKTINVLSLPDHNTLDISTPLNIKEVINFSGYAYRTSTGSMRPLPFAAGGTNDIRLDLENYVLRIVTYADWTSYGAYITIQYTKTTS